MFTPAVNGISNVFISLTQRSSGGYLIHLYLARPRTIWYYDEVQGIVTQTSIDNVDDFARAVIAAAGWTGTVVLGAAYTEQVINYQDTHTRYVLPD